MTDLTLGATVHHTHQSTGPLIFSGPNRYPTEIPKMGIQAIGVRLQDPILARIREQSGRCFVSHASCSSIGHPYRTNNLRCEYSEGESVKRLEATTDWQ